MMTEEQIKAYYQAIEDEFEEWMSDDATHWMNDEDAAWQAWKEQEERKAHLKMAAEAEAKALDEANALIQQQKNVIEILNRDIASYGDISDFDDHGISRSERIRLLKKRKKEGQEKRKLNRKQSLWLLKELKVKHEVKNYGGHIIVTGKDFIFDFRPSTGGFIGRDGGPEGRGVFGLIKHCDVDEKLLKKFYEAK